MSIFGNLTNEGLEETTDRLGGFQIRATDIYPATIKAAYAGQSAGGARNVTIVAELPDGEYSETIYVTNKKGVYAYVLTREERNLNIRAFTPAQKREAYEHQKGLCKKCRKPFGLDGMEADHITPWIEGGKTHAVTCQMLCRECNRRKSDH